MVQGDIRSVVEAVKRGDHSAFGQIVGEYQARLRMFMRVILWDHNQVDDLTQETFITAYTRIHTFDADRSEFYYWLKGIARNLAANANRRSKRHESAHDNYLAELRINSAWSAADEAGTFVDSAIERLRSCLRGLPEKMQGLFREFYIAGKKAALIAEENHKSISAVKVTLMRGRQLLKTCMQGLGEAVE